MAECTTYVAMEVSGAGTTEVNGIYIPYSTVTSGDPAATYTIWTKDGGDSYPRILPNRSFSTLWGWYIQTNESNYLYRGIGPIGNTYWNSTITSIDCPSELSWTIQSGGANPAPVVTGLTVLPGPSQNTFGLPAEVVALITSRFGTVANFLRLRNQGQV